MATIFRPKWKRKAKDGKPAASGRLAKWYIRYRLPDGRVKTVAGFKDKKATQSKADELERKAERLAAGRGDPHEDHSRRPLADHIEDYRTELESKARSAKYVELTAQRLRDLTDACGFVWIRDIEPGKVLAQLADYRRAGMSARSSNHYLSKLKSFSAWLVRDRRAEKDAVRFLAGVNADKDPRHLRRALSDADFAELLAAAAKSAEVLYGLDGRQRAALYVVAAYTGLRAKALASLTAGSFDLEAGTVTVHPGYQKNAKPKTQPLQPALAAKVGRYIANKLPAAKLWPGEWAKHDHGAEMVRADLAAASQARREARKLKERDPDPLPYEDGAGRKFDFHALRGQFGSMLARAGVHPRKAQELLGHSDINLTMKFYTRLEMADLHAAVGTLPAPPPDVEAEAQAAQATGTDGAAHTSQHTPKTDKSVHAGASRKPAAGAKNPTRKSKGKSRKP